MEKIMLQNPVTVMLLLFIFFIHMTKYANCSVCVYLAHNCDIFGVYHNWLQSDAAFVYPRLDSTA